MVETLISLADGDVRVLAQDGDVYVSTGKGAFHPVESNTVLVLALVHEIRRLRKAALVASLAPDRAGAAKEAAIILRPGHYGVTVRVLPDESE